MANHTAGDEKTRLDCFDGTDPGAYKSWKRRAMLMIAGLPSTISAEKHGARLMEYVKGEAEALLEQIEVEDIVKEGGDKKIWAILDDKYLPQPRDLLQQALKGFFYELSIKPGESYQQFFARYEAATRKLKEQKLELPAAVRGFMLIRKLRLEPSQESMVLTATGGKLEYKEVYAAVRSVFPEGKGPVKGQREVFQAEVEVQEDAMPEEDEVQDVLEAIADTYQDSGDEEDAVECFETYSEIRRKIQEKKKVRGFQTKPDAPAWKLSGTVQGRIEQIKSRTRCRKCGRIGHWKRECPEMNRRHGGGERHRGGVTETNKEITEVHSAEVAVLENDEKHDHVWQLFQERPEKDVSWTSSVDVQRDGFSDTHATGNQQRQQQDDHGNSGVKDVKPAVTVATKSESPTRGKGVRDFPDGEIKEVYVCDGISRGEVLSADAGAESGEPDLILASHAVPDTACRRTLIGEYTLSMLGQHLKRQGCDVQKRKGKSEFRFGNAGILVSREVAIIPACVGGKRLLIKASILPGSGQYTPLLLSKELLKQLGAVIDLEKDRVEFRRLGKHCQLGETRRGHYAIPMFQFRGSANDCFENEIPNEDRRSNKSQNVFDISQLERRERLSRSSVQEERDRADPRDDAELCRELLCRKPFGHEPAVDGGKCPESYASHWTSENQEGVGHDARCGRGCHRQSGEGELHPHGGQVPQEEGGDHSRRDLQVGQRICGLGPNSHWSHIVHGDAEAGSAHSTSRCSQGRKDQAPGSKSAASDTNDEHCGKQVFAQECSKVPESSRTTARRRYDDGGAAMGFGGTSHGSARDARPSSSQQFESRATANDADGLGSLCEESSESEQDRDGGNEAPHREHEQGDVGQVPDEHGQELENAWENGSELRKERDSNCTWPEKEKNDGIECVMKKCDRKTLQRNVNDIYVCEHEGCHDFQENEKCEVMSVQIDGCYGVGEVFSMPRVVPAAERKGFRGCKSYDISNGWNFLLAEHRAKCRDEVKRLKPELLVLSPPCGPFSQILNISKARCNSHERRRKYLEGVVLLEFAMELCQLQHEQGRKFLFEHPKGAASWSEDCVQRVQGLSGVREVITDMCMFGLKDPQTQKRYRKSTRLLTNSKYGDMLKRKCNGKHDHQHIEGQTKCGCKWVNRSSVAQVYTRDFVDAILSVARKESKNHDMDVLTVEELSKEQDKQRLKNLLLRCHVNLGHPSRERFIHMLKSANASEEAMKCAKELNCSTCAANRLKDLNHVAKKTRAEGFNQQVNMDTFDLPIYQQKILKMLNVLCEGTGLQICIPLWKGAKACEVRKAYRKYWLRWAGTPVRILTDGGTEFEREAQEGFDRDGTFVEKTAAFSPWQNGACERHGGEWKKIFQKAFEETQPMTKLEVNELIDHVNNAKNTMQRRHGYSPMQHVFGNEIRLPGVAITEQDYVRGTSRYHPGDACLRATEMRLAARKALVEVDNEDKVRRAVQHRTRQHEDFQIGQVVYYWRVIKEKERRGAWRGPARIIGIHDSSRLWVAHGNKVFRCSPEQVRHVTEEQAAAIRFLPVEALRQAGRYSKRGPQTFTDLTSQARPSDVDHGRPTEDDGQEREAKRSRREEDEAEPLLENQAVEEGAIDEESTQLGQDQDMPHQVTETETPPEVLSRSETDIVGARYGPIRDRHQQHEAPDLTTALRRSADLLDVGVVRVPRTPFASTKEDVFEVSVLSDEEECHHTTTEEIKMNFERCEKHLESFLVNQSSKSFFENDEVFLIQDRRNNELKTKDIQSPEDRRREEAGKRLEWQKLIQTGAVLVHRGEKAREIERNIEPGRILQSRYVKTRKMDAENPQESEIKCRWVIKGYQDPDLDDLERQSPTLTADGLAVVLQLTASMKWTLQIADVEGAFLQGEKLERKHGKIFARLPPCGTPGMDQHDIVELIKCVYGLIGKC